MKEPPSASGYRVQDRGNQDPSVFNAGDLIRRSGLVSPRARVERVGSRSYRVGQDDLHFLAKVIEAEDETAIHALSLAEADSHRTESLLQKVLAIRSFETHVIALLEWIDGVTVKQGSREDLPRFFAKLGAWHRGNQTDEPVASPYTGRRYDDIGAYLAETAACQLERMDLTSQIDTCRSYLSPLTNGFKTLVHGDVHPGNILQAGNRYVLLDPELVHIDICFLDLDYLNPDPTNIESREWWWIGDEAVECVRAYLRSTGIPNQRAFAVVRAVHILTLMRSYTNALESEGHESERFRNALLLQLS
jgi:hypothetical protein